MKSFGAMGIPGAVEVRRSQFADKSDSQLLAIVAAKMTELVEEYVEPRLWRPVPVISLGVATAFPGGITEQGRVSRIIAQVRTSGGSIGLYIDNLTPTATDIPDFVVGSADGIVVIPLPSFKGLNLGIYNLGGAAVTGKVILSSAAG